jgi:hypothetical protein
MQAKPTSFSSSSEQDLLSTISCLCAALVLLTAVEGLIIAVSRSGWEPFRKLWFYGHAGWLFLPGGALIGLCARGGTAIRFLALGAAFVTAYVALTQFRGTWIWDGTFDAFKYPRSGWFYPGLAGCLMAFGISFIPRKTPASSLGSQLWLIGLTAAVVLSVFLPRYALVNSDFAPTRWIALAAILLCLVVLYCLKWKSS